MKLVHIALSTLLIGASPFVLADDPVKTAINTASDMIKTGTDTASDVMKKGTKATATLMKSATDTLKDVADPSKIIDTITSTTKEESKDFKWTKAVIEAIAKGDPEKGKVVAKKAKCHKCHGDTGVSDEDDTPSIAGQIASYTFKQLHDYKVKIRDDKDMYKKVKKLSQQEMIDVSAWYATQKPEAMAGNEKKIPLLADKGDKKRFLIACNTCHNEDARKRGFQTPLIKGQKPEHFIETLLAFKEGERVNDHYHLMQSIASKLTEDEVTELAAYYAAKPLEEEED